MCLHIIAELKNNNHTDIRNISIQMLKHEKDNFRRRLSEFHRWNGGHLQVDIFKTWVPSLNTLNEPLPQIKMISTPLTAWERKQLLGTERKSGREKWTPPRNTSCAH